MRQRDKILQAEPNALVYGVVDEVHPSGRCTVSVVELEIEHPGATFPEDPTQSLAWQQAGRKPTASGAATKASKGLT